MALDQVQDKRVVQALQPACPGAITDAKFDRNELTLEIDPARIVEVSHFLKEKDQFVRLAAVTCVDFYPVEPRFEVIYHLHSISRNERLRLKCKVGGPKPEIDSVFEVWKAADWYEREVFDLFGVSFRNHPNLTRILMPHDWQGHPLRKDYPIHGFKYSYPAE
jgi:NADH-quinone oxidoreductase subunit C